MAKQERSPSIGEIVDYFLDSYDFPRRSDLIELTSRLASLEILLQDMLAGKKCSSSSATKIPVAKKKGRARKKSLSATDTVLLVIKKNGGSISFKEILEKTGFDDKKVRNIVFRLNKLGKITRENRGTYAFPES